MNEPRTSVQGRDRIEDLRAVIEPAENVSYSELIDRLNARNLPTAGIGNFVHEFDYRRGSSKEFVSWMRERYWDEEVEGGWVESSLWIARRP